MTYRMMYYLIECTAGLTAFLTFIAAVIESRFDLAAVAAVSCCTAWLARLMAGTEEEQDDAHEIGWECPACECASSRSAWEREWPLCPSCQATARQRQRADARWTTRQQWRRAA